jgi:hypothetical protein
MEMQKINEEKIRQLQLDLNSMPGNMRMNSGSNTGTAKG